MPDPKLPNVLWGKKPWVLDHEGMTIYDANMNRLLDIRGWGALTGTGGGLGMKEKEAIEAQKQLGEYIVHLVNNAK